MAEAGYPFLKGGGEMGALIRSYDWAANPLGHISSWPVSLRVQVQLMLNSRFPMLIFWGPELITFYNDAFRPSLGEDGKHPGSLGQRGEDSWAESWPTIGPMIYNIMAGDDAVWFEDQKLPIFRDGKMGYAYWTYSFSAIADDVGAVSGILVTCSETTKAVESLLELRQTAERLDNVFAQVNAGIAQTNLEGQFTEVNERFRQILGYSREELLSKSINDITHPDDRAHSSAMLGRLLKNGEEFLISKRYIRKDGSVIWVNNSDAILEDASGRKSIIVVSIDNTIQKLQELQIVESENRFQNLIRDARVGMIVLTGEDMRVAVVNEAYCRLIGHSVQETINRPLFEVVPDAQAAFLPILKNVLHTGEPFILNNAAYSVHGADGQVINGFINVVYQPYREADGTITGVMALVQDVTDETLAQRRIEASEARFRKLVTEAPVAIGLFRGRELIIESPNEALIAVIGRGPEIEGKPLAQVMPELENQPFLKILDDVFVSGETFRMSEAKVFIMRDGVSEERYFNITFSPLFEEGAVTAILDISVDITEQVLARKKEEETQVALRGAIELAELATWTIDLRQERISYSPRLQEWLGLPERTLTLESTPLVHPRDQERVRAALTAAIAGGEPGTFDETYTITHTTTEQQRIVHSTGKVVFDESGKGVAINGTSQDVTIQRELQMALENEVQVRTEELASAVEELRTTNEELAEANTSLQHSNEELAQYAYVASHDLQEPLRKIQVFTGMLSKQQNLAQENKELVSKISSSSGRMSLLIQDLLNFSRLLKSDTLVRPVPLGELAAAVADDFELLIEEKGAVIEIRELPVIEAVSLQMNQLFNNLFSNALKFTASETAPRIQVTSQPAAQAAVRQFIPKPLPFAQYHHITFSDNGIGFETQYAEQIFEVFKRLHGRDTYPGSGIGLALCRRIVANHQGYLYAESTPGKGSTFHILLPDRQHEFVSTLDKKLPAFPANWQKNS